jgi:hypothetical protein
MGVRKLSVALDEQVAEAAAASAERHWAKVEGLLTKYADKPISLADACLIRSAEIHNEARILTFDANFRVYRSFSISTRPSSREDELRYDQFMLRQDRSQHVLAKPSGCKCGLQTRRPRRW